METIFVGKDEHQIEVKPLTLICKGKDVIEDITYKDRMPIDLETSIYHIDRCQTFHVETEKLVKMAFPNWNDVLTNENIKRQGMGFRHLVGRVDLTLKLMDMKVAVAWVCPENCLHPGVQVQLGDILIYLLNRGVK